MSAAADVSGATGTFERASPAKLDAADEKVDKVPVQFAISNPTADDRVPLLVSPWSDTTYRGS